MTETRIVRRRWTAAEEALLRARYPLEGARAVALALGRAPQSVRQRAHRLGVTGRRSAAGGKGKAEAALLLKPEPSLGRQPTADGRQPSPTPNARRRTSEQSRELQKWFAYIDGGRHDPQLRNELLGPHLALVRNIAVAVSRRTGFAVPPDELTQAGWLGLVAAAQGFDPERRLKFITYAQFRVRGAMLDELRKTDPVSPLTRGRGRDLQARRDALRQVLGKEPTDDDLLAAGGARYQLLSARVPQTTSLFERRGESRSGRGHTLAHELACLLTPARDTEVDAFFQEALRQLNLAEQTIVYLYYAKDATMQEIGRILQLSESRVSQLIRQCVEQLRRSFQLDQVA